MNTKGRTRTIPARVLIPCMGLLLNWHTAALADVEVWLTDPPKSVLFQKQNSPVEFKSEPGTAATAELEVDDRRTFQSIDGFGYTLTGGSAMHIARMDEAPRAALLRELFAWDGTNIGTSFLRVSIGASDLNPRPFSYDDLPAGETDPELKQFDLGPDKLDVVPVLQQILKINPEIKIMGSPWSAPPWMKDNRDFRGGSLKRDCYAVYARYLVKYLNAMSAAGVPIHSITVQNEPLHPGNNPSMLMLAPDQAEFVRDHLGPAFKAAGLKTRIIVYDHNCDRPDYPISILNDTRACEYIDGSAFHLYAGKIGALSKVHEAHPDKNLYFTEQWIGAPGNLPGDLRWHVENLVIDATRNWARTVLEWNLAADPRHQPHTDRGGCDRCLGAITIDGNKFVRNPAYYIIAHASKFVRPGSVRIDSNTPEGLPNVAFKTPSGKRVLIVLNKGKSAREFRIRSQGMAATVALGPGAVATYVW